MDFARYRPDDVVAALGACLGPARAARLDAVAAGRLVGVACVLDDLRDPHNTGAALRTCEAMGVLGVHVISRHHRFRSSVRVTQGCDKWLDVARWEEPARCIAAIRAGGHRLLVGSPEASTKLSDIDVATPVALAFGNEHTGPSPELLAAADGTFAIPMYGFSQSLNVSVSVAVSLHVVSEARRRHVGGRTDLDPAALQQLRARYYATELRHPEALVERWLADRAT